MQEIQLFDAREFISFNGLKTLSNRYGWFVDNVGARGPQELPDFGPLLKIPEELHRRQPGFQPGADRPSRYMQTLMRERKDAI
jgi:hypothetical protein